MHIHGTEARYMHGTAAASINSPAANQPTNKQQCGHPSPLLFFCSPLPGANAHAPRKRLGGVLLKQLLVGGVHFTGGHSLKGVPLKVLAAVRTAHLHHVVFCEQQRGLHDKRVTRTSMIRRPSMELRAISWESHASPFLIGTSVRKLCNVSYESALYAPRVPLPEPSSCARTTRAAMNVMSVRISSEALRSGDKPPKLCDGRWGWPKWG